MDVVIPNVLVKRPVRDACNMWDLHENADGIVAKEFGVIESGVVGAEADGALDDGGMKRRRARVVIKVSILLGHDASVSGDII